MNSDASGSAISTQASEIYRFDSFEVQVRASLLLHEGERVKIQELPFQMLLVLLESPGELMTREHLQSRLWANKTFADFDGSLRVALKKLRDALGDHASEPRFIKTVSGQGYKFIAEVEQVWQPAHSTLAKDPTSKNRPDPQPARRVRYKWIIATVAFFAVVAGLLAYFARRPVLEPQDRLLIGAFTNNSGNSSLDGMLTAPFRLKLEESPYLNLIPERAFQSALKDADRASLADQLRACVSLDGQVLLNGQIVALSKGYRVLLTAWRCKDGRALLTEKAKAASESELLQALDADTEVMRRRLGESNASLQKFNVPSTQATTSSLAALKAFTSAEEKRVLGREPEAIADYRLAVDLDPQFALAYARLGTIYFNTDEFALSNSNYQKAFELRDRSTDRERLYITTHYYAYCTGEIGRAIEAYTLWRKIYPRDMSPANNLAIEYLLVGEPGKAVDLARAAVRLDPIASQPYATLAQAYSMSGDYGDLNGLCRNPAPSKSDLMVFHVYCFDGDFARSDEAGMQHELKWALDNPQESVMMSAAATVAMYHGKVAEGERLFLEANQNAVKNGLTELAAEIQLVQAGLEADLGLSRPARDHVLNGLKLSHDNSVMRAIAAVAYARAGDITQAQSEAAKSAAGAPLNTLVNSSVLPTSLAAIELQRHKPASAIQALRNSRPFDFNYFLYIVPAYYRGLAYLDNRQPREAAAEFQRAIDHRAIEPYSPYITLSQLELGHTFLLLGDRASADRIFLELETTWAKADPDFCPLHKLHSYRSDLALRMRSP